VIIVICPNCGSPLGDEEEFCSERCRLDFEAFIADVEIEPEPPDHADDEKKASTGG
jgi:endogenous inhibitor of DNA gyrase (YacG/DUF329 family)